MKAALSFTITTLLMLILASCQVKESAPGGGLISGHKPTTNKFTIDAQAAKTLKAGDVLSFSLSFPFDMVIDTTGGTPLLVLKINSTNVNATYVAQADPKKLNFTYTILAGQEDANGVDVVSLSANGSTLQFDKEGVLTNCETSTLTQTNFPSIKVDTTSPVARDFDLTNIPGLYNVNEKINFTVQFSEKVFVTGIPKIAFTLQTGGAVEASYVSGSGSDLLNFSYNVKATDTDINGFNSLASSLTMTSATIKDAVGNDANPDLSAYSAGVRTYSAQVQINGSLPYVIGAEFPANGTYVANQDLDFVLQFDREVNVSGSPFINVRIGNNTREAHYIDGTGTEFIVFRYTPIPGDVDTDGIEVTGRVERNGGNIVDKNATAISFFDTLLLNTYFSGPSTTGIFVNAIQPQATSVTRVNDTTRTVSTDVVDNVWIIDQTLFITVGFNTPIYVDQDSGTPSLPVTIGATTKQATYLSGGNGQLSLVFKYVIEEGDLDADGNIGIGTMLLNGGVIRDAAHTSALLTMPVTQITTTFVDGVRPTIQSITSANAGTYSNQPGINHLTMEFRVNWSEPVNYSSTAVGAAYFTSDMGGDSVRIEYGTGNNSASVTHRPRSLANIDDTNGIATSSPLAGTAIIKDIAGNTVSDNSFTPPDTSGVLVDNTAPEVDSVVLASGNKTYKTGDPIEFTVTFNEQVTTNRAGFYPRIPITIGSTTRYLMPTTDSTNSVHTFRYTVIADELDTDGIDMLDAVESDGTTAYARDLGRNLVTGNFVQPDTSGVLVDAVAPDITDAVPTTAKAYVSGESIKVTVTYSEPVTVTGSPVIALDFDLGDDDLTLESGDGTDTLVFSRILDGEHFDMTGLPSVSSITGTVTDLAGNPADLDFTTIVLSTYYVTYPQILLWVKPNSSANLAPTGGASAVYDGAVTTEACGTGSCRRFTGDDALRLTGNMDLIKSVYMIVKTPSLVASHDIFDTEIQLIADSPNYDMRTTNGDLYINGAATGFSVNHDINLPANTAYLFQVDFTSTQNFNSGTLIPTTFNGSVGDVIAVEAGLSPTEVTNIQNYLNDQF